MSITGPDALQEAHEEGRSRRAADQLVLARFHANRAGQIEGPIRGAIETLLEPRRRIGARSRMLTEARRELTEALQFLDEAETILDGE